MIDAELTDRIGDRITDILAEKGQHLGIDRDLAAGIVAEQRPVWSKAATRATELKKQYFFIVASFDDEAGEHRLLALGSHLDPCDEANARAIVEKCLAQSNVLLRSFVAIELKAVIEFVENGTGTMH